MDLVVLVLFACASAVLGNEDGSASVASSATRDELSGTAPVISFLGTAPKGFRSDNWLGNYSVYTGKLVERKIGGLLSGRHVFAQQRPDGTQDASKLIWYRKHEGRWYVGRSRALDKAAGVLYVADTAMAPEQIAGQWQAWLGDKRGWESADLRIVSQAKARAILETEERSRKEAVAAAAVVSLVGSTPEGLRHEWLGEYHRSYQNGTAASGRPSYRKVRDEAKSLWFDGGTWFFGSSAHVGKRKGVFQAHDPAVVPSAVKHGAWLISPGKGKAARPATELRCVPGAEAADDTRRAHVRLLQSAKTVYLIDSLSIDGDKVKPTGNVPDWQGSYSLELPSGMQSRGQYIKHDYVSGLKWVMWYQERSGLWLLGKRKQGKKSPTKVFFSYDGAQFPHEIRSPWKRKTAQPGDTAVAGIRCFVGAEGSALLKAQSAALADLLSRSAASLALVGLRPGALHEWEGSYLLRQKPLHNDRQSFEHQNDQTKALWYDKRSRSWLIGRIGANHTEKPFPQPNRAVLRVKDSALVPDAINGTWQASRTGRWTDVQAVQLIAGSDVRAAQEIQARELERSARTVYFAGVVQPSSLSRLMGPYDTIPTAGMESWRRRCYRHRAHREESRKPVGDSATLELRYDESSGEWRLEQTWETKKENRTLLLFAYDGAMAPELITSQWRSAFNGRQKQKDEAADVVCRAGKEGLLAMEADRAAIALQRATVPGWPTWLFPVRLAPLMIAVTRTLQAGVSPTRVRAILRAAQGAGLSEELVNKVLFKVPQGPMKRRLPTVEHEQPQSWLTKPKVKTASRAKRERKRLRQAKRSRKHKAVPP